MGAAEGYNEIPMRNLRVTELVNVVLVTAVLLLNPEATIKKGCLAHLLAFLSTGKQPYGEGDITENKSTTGLRRSSSAKYLTPDLELVIKGSGPFANRV